MNNSKIDISKINFPNNNHNQPDSNDLKEKIDYEFIYRLEPFNRTYNVDEGIQAKTKDPLWMLGRQWQLEEFTAANGGVPVRVVIDYSTQTLDKIFNRDNKDQKISSEEPLEFFIEKESSTASPFWDNNCLEYNFSVGNSRVKLNSNEYTGDNMDWYSFNLTENNWTNILSDTIVTKPRTIKYHGMPAARWWSFEEGNVNLNALNRPYCNILTMALVEFSLIYSQDWYLFSMPITIGDIRKIQKLTVIDSFGIADEVKPTVDSSIQDNGFEVFTLSSNNENTLSDGTLFYFPNNLQFALESNPVEEVSFFRDEMSNMVWAIEHLYTDDKNIVHNRHDEESKRAALAIKPLHYWNETQLVDAPVDQTSQEQTLVPLYLEESLPPPHWIPYLPRKLQNQVVLLRGITYNGPDAQFKGQIIFQADFIAEEEITNVGIKVVKSVQLARATSGAIVEWTGRKKLPDQKRRGSNLKFDYLIRPSM